MPSKRYRTEIAKTPFLKVTDFRFENEEFLTFQESTNEFGYTGKDILHGVISVFVSSDASPKQAVKYDKSQSLVTPDAYMGSCTTETLYSLDCAIMGQYISAFPKLA